MLLPVGSRPWVEGLARLKFTFKNVQVVVKTFLVHPGKLWLGRPYLGPRKQKLFHWDLGMILLIADLYCEFSIGNSQYL